MSPYQEEMKDYDVSEDSIGVQAMKEDRRRESIKHLRRTSLDNLQSFEDDYGDVEFQMYENDEYITFSLKFGDSKNLALACRLIKVALLFMPCIYPTSIAPPEPFVTDASPHRKRKNE